MKKFCKMLAGAITHSSRSVLQSIIRTTICKASMQSIKMCKFSLISPHSSLNSSNWQLWLHFVIWFSPCAFKGSFSRPVVSGLTETAYSDWGLMNELVTGQILKAQANKHSWDPVLCAVNVACFTRVSTCVLVYVWMWCVTP